MHKTDWLLCVLILLFTAISVFWQQSHFPPFAFHSFIHERLFSGSVGVLLIFIVMLIGRNLFESNKFGLLCGIILATQPWFVQEARIFSPILYCTFLITVGFYLIQRLKVTPYKNIRVFLALGSIFIIGAVLWGKFGNTVPLEIDPKLLRNFFSLFSFDTFFLSNNSFWFGETTDVGIFLPEISVFLFFGLLWIRQFGKYGIFLLLWIVLVACITINNPTYPEERNFFLAVLPFIFISVFGLRKMLSLKDKIYRKIIVIGSILLYSYSYLYFLHVYFIHNSQKIFQFMDKIYGHF